MTNYHWYQKPVNGAYPKEMALSINCRYIAMEEEAEPNMIDRYRLVELGRMNRVEFRRKYNC